MGVILPKFVILRDKLDIGKIGNERSLVADLALESRNMDHDCIR